MVRKPFFFSSSFISRTSLADNRIAQYETNYRIPKRELLDKMAEALRADRQNF
jgi:transcriptional regulator with XRE-family HTH domain